MSILTVYKASLPSVNVILPSGKVCVFINGTYRTDIEEEIAYFDREIKIGHPHLYVPAKEEERTIDSELVDPTAMLRHTIEQEILAKYGIAAGDPKRDMGKTDKNLPLMPGNSHNIAEAAAGGSGASARLVNLQSK